MSEHKDHVKHEHTKTVEEHTKTVHIPTVDTSKDTPIKPVAPPAPERVPDPPYSADVDDAA